MLRTELRAIVRRALGPEASASISDAEINSLANQGIRELCRDLGGVYADATVSTDADGFASLAALVEPIRIVRVSYGDTKLEQMTIHAI